MLGAVLQLLGDDTNYAAGTTTLAKDQKPLNGEHRNSDDHLKYR